jgi:predicted exporter
VTRGARVTLALWIALLLACGGWLLRHLSVSTDLSGFLPRAATPAQEVLVDQLRAGVAARLMLMGIEGADSRALAGASRALAQSLEASGAFETVANGDPSRRSREGELLFALRYTLSPGVRAQRFSVQGLRAALQEELELLASPLGLLTRRSLPADPTGEFRRIATQLGGAAGPVLGHGVWQSADGKRALLVAQTRAAGFDLDAQARAAALVHARFAELAPAGASLRLAGPGLAAVAARATIEADALRATLISLVGVLLVLAAVYRSPWPVVLSALPAASGMLAGATAVSVLFGPVHGITLAFGAVLVGEAVDYPTYLYAHAARGEPLTRTAARIWPTLGLAILTTACGALAMLLSSFRGLAQLGTLLIVGIGVSGLVVWRVLPALTPAHALYAKSRGLPFDASPLSPLRERGPWLVALAVLGAALVIAAHRDRMWDDDLANLSPVPAALKAIDGELRSQLGAPDLRHLVAVRAATREAALQASERLVPVLQRAVTAGWIGGYDMAARYLPSRHAQEQRRAALPEPAALAARLEQATQGLPFRPGVFAPFLADVERARRAAWLDADIWQGTAIAPRLESLLVQGNRGWVALAPLTAVRNVEALDGALRAHGDDAVLHIDLKREADALVAGYRLESLRLFAFGLACIALLVFAGLRDGKATLRVLAPALAAALLTVATLLAAGSRLTIVHLVALLLVIGVALNYALFFNRRAADDAERALTRLTVLAASLTTLCAAVALSTCSTPVLRAIGVTVICGTLYAFLLGALLARKPV